MPQIVPLNPPRRVLMGPGPSDAHPTVLRAMAAPLIGHMDPSFIAIMDEIKAMLQQVFLTKNELTFAVSAPGSAGMETCFVNLLERGDEAIVCVNGVFGNRMCENVERCGAKLIRLDNPWGQPFESQQIAGVAKTCKPKHAVVTAQPRNPPHRETGIREAGQVAR